MLINKHIKIIAFLLMCCVGLFAKNVVNVDPSIGQYIQKSKSWQMEGHRTGLLKGADKLFENITVINELPAELNSGEAADNLTKWFSNNCPEYNVVYPEITPKISSFYKMHLQMAGLDVEKTMDDGTVWVMERSDAKEEIVRGKLWQTPPSLSVEDLKKMGVLYLRKYLRQFKGKVEYENNEVEYEGIDGKRIITEISLRFRQVFNRGAVLRNISFIYITMDGYGEIRRIKIKWPKFEKISVPFSSKITAEQAYLKAQAQSENRRPYHKSNGEIINIKELTLTGMARGWLPKNVGGAIIITPSYSFTQKTELESGEEIYRYLDVPVNEKYGIDE